MRPVDFTDVVYGADSRMTERRGGSCLSIETFHQRRLGRAEFRDLDRNSTIELRVMSLVNRAHRSLAKAFFQAIATELRWQNVPCWGDRFGDRI